MGDDVAVCIGPYSGGAEPEGEEEAGLAEIRGRDAVPGVSVGVPGVRAGGEAGVLRAAGVGGGAVREGDEGESGEEGGGGVRGFACSKCHGVHDYGRLDGRGWNELIMHLSGGLLYGKEVRKPAWWKAKRRRAHAPRPGSRPSKRAEQIAGFLVNTGLSCSEIAGRLGLSPGTVQGWVWRIYQRNGVHGRRGIAREGQGERRQEARVAG